MVDRTVYAADAVPELPLRRQKIPEDLCKLVADSGLRSVETFAMLGDTIAMVKQTFKTLMPDHTQLGADQPAQELALTSLPKIWSWIIPSAIDSKLLSGPCYYCEFGRRATYMFTWCWFVSFEVVPSILNTSQGCPGHGKNLASKCTWHDYFPTFLQNTWIIRLVLWPWIWALGSALVLQPAMAVFWPYKKKQIFIRLSFAAGSNVFHGNFMWRLAG